MFYVNFILDNAGNIVGEEELEVQPIAYESDDDDCDEGGEYCHYCDAPEGDGCSCGQANEG